MDYSELNAAYATSFKNRGEMPSVYKNRDTYYLHVQVRGKRVSSSLRTTIKRVAHQRAKELETSLISILLLPEPKTIRRYSEKELARLFLDANHGWSEKTFNINNNALNHYFANGLPTTTYRAMIVRILNHMYNWALRERLIPHEQHKHFEGGTKRGHRSRVLNPIELNLILQHTEPYQVRLYFQFLYYTGTRRSEILGLSEASYRGDHIIVRTKGQGVTHRMVRLTKQAVEVLKDQGVMDEQGALVAPEKFWSYAPTYISSKFGSEATRLGIKDVCLHDLRRTFGYNLLLQGVPIFEVSKLLGHRSVGTTERHYAPLMPNMIPQYEL